MTDLTDALALLRGINVYADRRIGKAEREAFQSVVDAAHRVADADQIWWCDFHKAGGLPGTDCWGAGLDGQDTCRMVRRPLLKPGRDG